MSTHRRYRIEHRTAYHYSDTVSASYGRGYLRPRELPWQDCEQYSLVIEPTPSDAADSTDVYGNVDSYFHVTSSHTDLVVTGVSVVQVRRPELDLAAAARPWEEAQVGAVDAEGVEFLLASPYIQITDEVREYAAVSFTPGRPAGESLLDLVHRIHADFRYRSGATTVGTPIPRILAEREGVCQDFAHLVVACARAHRVPARYVSGYLATDPPPGRERMVGVDASHAWAAVRLPGGHWLAVDPTNDQLVDERYTTVAWGRDYGDVPPLRGVIFTDAETSTMKVAVDVAPL
ncbi:Transglutaminase-like enzyme, putative cysteine protease [Nakamurella panacisegetis]|uniref:Transglutaminase-like enzyme, putative cysteine protease n=1 Tax=Nakamurella panacisegetis TaxID=1090615 RepID=A0A1H0QX09_9ACTN|nr:transglutaminase family protein [Nakamurella panacisegetis]SDP21813.1 Transglutaminase-like enzyme, putative cysteine protease [Nakamurella panacisegetis]